MGGIGGSFYINMLNGSDAQSLAKDAETSGHLHRSKELADFKMGVQDARLYYPDSVPNGQDNFPLSFPGEQSAVELGAQTGRFYSAAAAPLGNCAFSRSSAAQAYAGADGHLPDSKDGYSASADSYHAHFQHGFPRTSLYSLPGLQVCGKTQVLLNNYPLWAKFHKYQTEMIITKQGR